MDPILEREGRRGGFHEKICKPLISSVSLGEEGKEGGVSMRISINYSFSSVSFSQCYASTMRGVSMRISINHSFSSVSFSHCSAASPAPAIYILMR